VKVELHPISVGITVGVVIWISGRAVFSSNASLSVSLRPETSIPLSDRTARWSQEAAGQKSLALFGIAGA